LSKSDTASIRAILAAPEPRRSKMDDGIDLRKSALSEGAIP